MTSGRRIISKVFEHCILEIIGSFFSSCTAQSGSYTGSGCRNAIYSVQKVADKISNTGCTANICSIDLS